MLTDFQNSVTDRLSSKVLITKSHIKRVATLPCEIVVFKNRNDPELCEENWELSHSKHMPKNIYPVMLASFLFTDKKIFIIAALNNRHNDWQNASAVTKKIWHNFSACLTSLISFLGCLCARKTSYHTYLSSYSGSYVCCHLPNVHAKQQLKTFVRRLFVWEWHCPGNDGYVHGHATFRSTMATNGFG